MSPIEATVNLEPEETFGSVQNGVEDIPVAYQDRSSLIASRARKIPLTEEGLPVGYYRADLLPNALSSSRTLTDQELEAAFVELSYEEGFPALPSGHPFWHKLAHEPNHAYLAFQIYADPNTPSLGAEDSTTEKAIESLYSLQSTDSTHIRMLARVSYHPALRQLLPIDANEALQTVQEWYHLYYWKDRVKALELYKESAYRIHRQRRALSTEDNHYRTAKRLFDKCTEIMSNDNSDFWDSISHKEVIDVFKTAASLQRISSGLPAAAPLTAREEALAQLSGQTNGDLELIMRSTAKRRTPTHTNSGYTLDADGRVIADHNSLMSDLLEDSDVATVMQEVIIKMSNR